MSSDCNKCGDASMIETIHTLSNCNASPCATPVAAPCYSQAATPQLYAIAGSDFSFPAQTFGTPVYITNVKLAEGQIITSTRYGTLRVAAILDSVLGYYELTNDSVDDVTIIGRPVPCGTVFFLGAPTSIVSSGDGGGCNPLIADFIVPIVGQNAPAKVQSLAGFAINDKVIFRSKANPSLAYKYLVVGFSGVDTVILKNEGEGGTAFQTISAGEESAYLWCVESLSDQGIGQQAVVSNCVASVLGLDSNGNLLRISGNGVANNALVFDSTCSGYTNKVIADTKTCALLNTNFQISPTGTCRRTAIFITTSQDALLLATAAAASLSSNADPLILINDREFYLDIAASSAGNLKVIPNFPVITVLNFAAGQSVCIPDDCCSQCSPQVQFPVSATFPPGRNIAMQIAIPTALLNAIGEFKFSMVKTADGASNILLLHNSTSDFVVAAYNDSGASISIPSGVDNLSTVPEISYFHTSACPIEALYSRDVTVNLSSLPANVNVQMNYNTQLGVYNCDNTSIGGRLLSTQMSNTNLWRGPTTISTISSGSGQWGIPLAPGIFHSYGIFTAYNARSLPVFIEQAVVIKTIARLLIQTTAIPTPGSFIFIQLSGTDVFKTHRI